jgi:hypothetical protein
MVKEASQKIGLGERIWQVDALLYFMGCLNDESKAGIAAALSWRLKHQLVWVKGGCGNMAV